MLLHRWFTEKNMRLSRVSIIGRFVLKSSIALINKWFFFCFSLCLFSYVSDDPKSALTNNVSKKSNIREAYVTETRCWCIFLVRQSSIDEKHLYGLFVVFIVSNWIVEWDEAFPGHIRNEQRVQSEEDSCIFSFRYPQAAQWDATKRCANHKFLNGAVSCGLAEWKSLSQKTEPTRVFHRSVQEKEKYSGRADICGF